MMLPDKIFNFFFHHSPIGQYLLAPTEKLEILAVNQAFLSSVSRARAQVEYRPLFEVFPNDPDDQGDTGVQDLARSIAAAVASGESQTMVAQRYPIEMHGDGRSWFEDMYWSATNTPIYDDDGTLLCISHTTINVTEQVRSAVSLSESEARVRAMMDQSSAGIAQTTLEGQFIFVNDRYCSLVGRSREELMTLRMHQLTHPDHLPANSKQFDNLTQGGAAFEIEKRYLRPDGSAIWVRNSVTGVRDVDGRVQSILAVSVDISEQKSEARRKEFLLKITDRLRTEATGDSIMDATAELLGRHLGASRVGYVSVQPDDQTITFERSYVQGVAVLTGSHVFSRYGETNVRAQRHGETLVVNDTRVLETHPYWDEIHTRAFVSVPRIRENRFRAAFYVSYCQPHAWSKDEIALIKDVAARTWDALERTSAETALRDMNETLGHRIAIALQERSKVEEALRQSQKMEAVGQLTGGLAHDFNNLLAGISGALQLMQMRMQQGRFHDFERYIATAQGASKRAAALTHRLLAFSRQQTLTPKPTDVNRLIAGMHELIQRTVGPATPIEVVGVSDAWTALVDASQLENALLNLCINSRDAMPNGGRITVETANKWIDERAAQQQNMAQGQYLTLSVSDTGVGMSPEIIVRAFDPFFTTKPIGQGTGLGLSMIYGFAQQSGGQVRIYSEVGQGTTVCIYLPRHYGDSDDSTDTAPIATLQHSQQVATVLVVDDEPTVRMLVIDILEDLGYSWLEAENSAEGLKILQSDARIDLLISDVGLPGGMNGRQMADAGCVGRTGLQVLFITGYAENALLNNGYLGPGMTVLTKPFSIDVMAERIRSMINESLSNNKKL
ncbi:MAG: PAS domain S-box protein [Janthinobacterium lividum]